MEHICGYNSLPEDCISHIISLTSPRDACRLSAVSTAFKSSADSDAVWENFLPFDYRDIVLDSDSSSSLLTSLSKKDLYFHLCCNPVLIHSTTMSFTLEKESGKKCYMIGARSLSIAWRDATACWLWKSLPESRFAEVVELKFMWWMDIKGMIETKILSPKTTYAAYLVFKFAESRYGFDIRPVELSVYFEGTEPSEKKHVFLDPPSNISRPLFLDRGDGWMEIEMGEFFNECQDDGIVVCSIFDFDGFSHKHGLVIEGIELRPKNVYVC